MKIETIIDRVEGVPHMNPGQAKEITSIVLENKYQNLLELGFDHGVSTCYLAGALDESGGGRITTIDRESAKDAEPSIETLLESLSLRDRVDVIYEPHSYIWRLMKMLEDDPSPRFDFCFIDGACPETGLIAPTKQTNATRDTSFISILVVDGTC